MEKRENVEEEGRERRRKEKEGRGGEKGGGE
jgi:hypothetical protein